MDSNLQGLERVWFLSNRDIHVKFQECHCDVRKILPVVSPQYERNSGEKEEKSRWMKCTNNTTTCEPGGYPSGHQANTQKGLGFLPWNMAPPGINEQRMAEKSSIFQTFYQRRMWCCNRCVLEGLCVHGSRFKITRVTGFIAGKKSSIWLMFHSSSIVSIHCILSTMILSGKLAAVLRQWLWCCLVRINIGNTYDMNQDNQDPAVVKERVKWIKDKGPSQPFASVGPVNQGDQYGSFVKNNKQMCSFVCRTIFSKTCENGFWVAVQMENEVKWLWMMCPSKKANCKKL